MSSEPNIPYLFQDSEEIVKVVDWESHITSNSDTYKNCFVRRFTHVKNLGSSVLHEYLNVVVQDDSNDTCTRLIVERDDPTDQVIVGRWGATKDYDEEWKPEDCFYQPATISSALSGVPSSSGPAGDLPLPLSTCSFEKSAFTVESFASLLKRAHNLLRGYTHTKYDGYWYAVQVFYGVSLELKVTHSDWIYLRWRGDKLRLLDPDRKAVNEATRRFIDERSHHPIDGNPVDSAKDYDTSLKRIIEILGEVFTEEPYQVVVDEEETENDRVKYHESINSCAMDAKDLDVWEMYESIGKANAYQIGWKASDFLDPLIENEDKILEGPTDDEEKKALEQAFFINIGKLKQDVLD